MLAAIRPFTLLPQSIFWLISASSLYALEISSFWKICLLIISSSLSFFSTYFCGYFLYKNFVHSWLVINLPRNIKKAHKNGTLITLCFRIIFFIPYDIGNFVIGLLGFGIKKAMGSLVIWESLKAFIFVTIADNFTKNLNNFPSEWWIGKYGLAFIFTIIVMSLIVAAMIVGLNVYFFFTTESLVKKAQTYYYMCYFEIQNNNNIKMDEVIDFRSDNKCVLLLYGFFASRRTLKVMHRLLKNQGYTVFSLNLGGLFGVFFTKNIINSAYYLDKTLKNLINKNSQQHQKQQSSESSDAFEFSIVAHSKGGLVAAWWLLRLGGHKYCKKLITMGTPFGGTYVTWFALATPLGFLWSDIWQMRPNAKTLKAIEDSYIPNNIKIHCFYSAKDFVSRNKKGILQAQYGNTSNVCAVAMHDFNHFDYLYRKKVVEKIVEILEEP